MNESKLNESGVWRSWKRYFMLVALAFAVHFFVLVLIYPGYYHPLWPNHDDFYMPMAVTYSPLSIEQLLRYPRPVGLLFFKLIGYLGIHGSIFSILLITVVNCSLSAEMYRKFVGAKFDVIYASTFVLYLFILFSQPYFYVFSNHDAFSQLSFTLLVISFWLLSKVDANSNGWILISSLAFATLAFLAKETYGLSALLLAFTWFIARRKHGLIKSILPGVVIGAALSVGLAVNSLNSSPFTSGSNDASAPYHIVLNPLSITQEWYRYASDGMNAFTIGIVLAGVFTGLIIRKNCRCLTLSVLLPISGALAWLPNALLPNHHFSGYSWNGFYLIFLPVLSLGLLLRQNRTYRIFALAVAGMALSSPLLSKTTYKKNAWDLIQEKTQRHLLKALTNLTNAERSSNLPTRILVTGIDFPFSPFNQPYSIKMYPHTRNLSFDVVSYGPWGHSGAIGARVFFISSKAVVFSKYQEIWAFRSDGTLAKALVLERHGESVEKTTEIKGLTTSDLLLYPELLDVFKRSIDGDTEFPSADQYLKCGISMISYNNLLLATVCIDQSVAANPSNPYPYFYLGKIEYLNGSIEAARAAYDKAISLDSTSSPNPLFLEALQQLKIKENIPTKSVRAATPSFE